ncbi:FAD-dependent oxidoreductase [Thalassomonas haliotis]|uniref:D-amino-acid oxidase n=1 Tax=Thalassomonas haliotis TaxID=485448 RepID=A0ABY7VEB6_9GAMM|nr:FAD-dependent oxidoreductase [Thalassomonas haliotis]WDE12064.1 FAD-dependent oxidoreductase [Thalassomonas haliotis]
MANIAIVGAGLIGRLTALTLHRQGYRVSLFDKDDKGGHNSAAYAAAGLLTPLGEAIGCEANIVTMGLTSLKLWPDIIKTLAEPVFFQQSGALLVSHTQDQGDYLRFKRFLQQHYPENPAENLDRSALLALEPELGRSFNQGLYLPQEGQIGNRRLLRALCHQLETEQVNWLSNCEVTGIHPGESTSALEYLHSGQKRRQSYDLIIDCRGLGAKKTGKDSGVDLKALRGVRGELFQLFAPEVNISRPVRLMHPRYQLYIAPKTKGYYVVGATEIESEDNSPMTVRSALELLSAAYSVHPGFAEANIRQHISQHRPAFADNQAKILLRPGLLQVNGLYRHGFLIAPVVLQQINALVAALTANLSETTRFSPQMLSQLIANSQLPYSHLLPTGVYDENLH